MAEHTPEQEWRLNVARTLHTLERTVALHQKILDTARQAMEAGHIDVAQDALSGLLSLLADKNEEDAA